MVPTARDIETYTECVARGLDHQVRHGRFDSAPVVIPYGDVDPAKYFMTPEAYVA
jgi:hypothetical protein